MKFSRNSDSPIIARAGKTRTKTCPICGHVFVPKSGSSRRARRTTVSRHIKVLHRDYYKQGHRWDLLLLSYFGLGSLAMFWLFWAVCSRYSSLPCDPPIIQGGIYSSFFPVAVGIFILPVAAAAYVRLLVLQRKFRRDWQTTHGQTSMGNERRSQTSPGTPPPTDQ